MDRVELGGTWKLRRLADGSDRPIVIPGDIMSALIASGEISDPYFDRNELELQWIGREDWLLEREVTIDSHMAAAPSVCLEFEVLDTVAEVRLNGELVGVGRNMFRRFRAEVGGKLKPGSNKVSVLIRSPELAAAEAAAKLPYPMPYSEYPVTSPHRNLIRKAQCMGGWDWGPCLMTGGIYDGASLFTANKARIEYATTRMRRVSGTWKVDATVELHAAEAHMAELELSLAGAQASRTVQVPAGSSSFVMELDVSSAREWFPAGHGEQPLYEMIVRCYPKGSEPKSGTALRKRLGFREILVVADEDEAGKSMTFRVNGRDIFCKGANWIPADALPSRWTRERLDDLLSSAVNANMNCLRVWGGGRYESDDFYDLCDEKGILVWQDCMFSCALYPSAPAFLAEVEAEIRHQVKRIKDHPSLALWCGNNEALGALLWYPESKKNPTRYLVDYDRLYEGTLGRVVRELDPDRCWWPSSPSGGPDDYSDNWHGDGRGDMHFWSVWHEGKSFSEYLTVKPRFCSEFGFQSFPNFRTVVSFAPEGERNVTSPTMEHHQRHTRGNTIIMETMSRYFRMPSGQRETLYLSQVQQARAIRTAVEYWRSLRPLCMGTLYWQLNDVWPVSSWSSLDYDGSWKLLHYEARRFFEALHLALITKDGAVRAVAVNDGLDAYAGGLGLRLRRLDGSVAADYSTDVSIPPESSSELRVLEVSNLPCKPEEAFLEARLELRSENGRRETRSALAFLTEPKRCSLPDPRLEAKIVAGEESLELVLRSEKPAFYVVPTLEGNGEALDIAGRFEDAGFHLMPGEERRLRFLPAHGGAAPSVETLHSALRLLHLRASYE
ncbi:MAG: glycoside hydrolase family 2 protein [Rectinemataceae bacterium]|jgi:beta-mannosidase